MTFVLSPSVCDGSSSRAFTVKFCHIQMCVYVMCFNVRLPQQQPKHICLKVAQINRSVWIKGCVWGEKCGACVCALSRLAYFLFLTTWETTSQGRQTTSHIRGILISCLAPFTSHPQVLSPFPFCCFPHLLLLFVLCFDFFIYISYFHSLPISHSFCANC